MSVDRLAELLRERQLCVVLTGAGISTQMHGDFRTSRLDDPKGLISLLTEQLAAY